MSEFPISEVQEIYECRDCEHRWWDYCSERCPICKSEDIGLMYEISEEIHQSRLEDQREMRNERG